MTLNEQKGAIDSPTYPVILICPFYPTTRCVDALLKTRAICRLLLVTTNRKSVNGKLGNGKVGNGKLGNGKLGSGNP